MKLNYLFITALLLFGCSANNETASPSTTDGTETHNEQSESAPTTEQTSEGDQVVPQAETVKIDAKKTASSKKTEKPSKENIASTAVSSEKENVEVEETKMMIEDFSGVYNQILNNFVSSSGKVNYAGIKTNKELLGQAVQYFEENPPKSSWSDNQQLAYWINAYNLFTLKLVVDNYPVSSIKDIAGGKPWDKKFIQLDGRTLSLNDIENGIIRKEFDEPRIHFAVNCASISCPKLLNKAYTSSNLNSLLEAQTKSFINDNAMNKISASTLEISNIFDWYKSDFTQKGSVIDFLNKYSSTKIDADAKISYKEYNWNLNK